MAMLRFNIKWLSLQQKHRLPLSSRMPIIEHESVCEYVCVCVRVYVRVRERGREGKVMVTKVRVEQKSIRMGVI
jgi:hypothetical protein